MRHSRGTGACLLFHLFGNVSRMAHGANTGLIDVVDDSIKIIIARVPSFIIGLEISRWAVVDRGKSGEMPNCKIFRRYSVKKIDNRRFSHKKV